MPNKQTPYSSALHPKTTYNLTFKRPSDPTVAGGGANPTVLGTYLCNNLSVDPPQGSVVRRTGVDGEPTDMSIKAEVRKMSATVQLKLSGTPSLQAGDYCEDSFCTGSDGNPEGNIRFVVASCPITKDAGVPWTQQISCEIDYENSPAYA